MCKTSNVTWQSRKGPFIIFDSLSPVIHIFRKSTSLLWSHDYTNFVDECGWPKWCALGHHHKTDSCESLQVPALQTDLTPYRAVNGRCTVVCTGFGLKVGSTFRAFGRNWRLIAGLGLPFRQVASCVRQFRSMWRAQVLSWRSSFNCSFFSCKSCKMTFSFWWCCLRSSWHFSSIIWCCCKVLLTGSWVFSLEARCWRQEAHVEVSSRGSSKDRICVFVSWMVPFVILIWLHVSRNSDSKRLLICWFTFTRSLIAFSDLAKASSAARATRWTNFAASSRSSFAACSRFMADWFNFKASCCRKTSFRAASCVATSCLAWAANARDRLEAWPRPNVLRSCDKVSKLREVVRRHNSSTERAWVFCWMSWRSSSSLPCLFSFLHHFLLALINTQLRKFNSGIL